MSSTTPSYSSEPRSSDRNNDWADPIKVYDRRTARPVPGPTALQQVEMDRVAVKENGGNGPAGPPSADNPTDKTRLVDDNGRAVLPGPNEPTDQITINDEEEEDIPNSFNLYRNKKLISHGMMDVALFSANANQLRYVLESNNGDGVVRVICITLLLISIFLQVLVGIGLLLSARYNVTNCEQRKMAFKFGNYVIVGIFLITVVNIFITSFGGPSGNPPTILLAPSIEQRMFNDTDAALTVS